MMEVFLFFRAHEVEWWLGPVVGGAESFAKSSGSLLQVIPDTSDLTWRRSVAPSEPENLIQGGASHHRQGFGLQIAAADGSSGLGQHQPLGDDLQAIADAAGILTLDTRWWSGFALSVALAACALTQVLVGGGGLKGGLSALMGQSCGVEFVGEEERTKSGALACVVCLEAPREILLLPCRHVCCCKACADRLERCPMCRAQKTAFAKVFL
mmetsp:Transcript_110394/g.356013  ORF Transcript_110394/g.356013 Transcript_110394/m.356013 type:complete len:211 (+) Transcript_110394:86-718(+)